MLLAMMAGVTSCENNFAEPPIPVPEGGIVGTGAWNNPMTAYQALIGTVNDTIDEPWVTGYIVGYINLDISSVLSARTATCKVPGNVQSNMLISMEPIPEDSLANDTLAQEYMSANWEKFATVQLPSGAARSALNLAENPRNINKLVTIKGETGTKYCGAYGVRSVSDYNWGDKGIPDAPDGPIDPVASLWQSFTVSDKMSEYMLMGWQNVEVSGGLSGWYIRNFNSNNYITVSAYLGNEAGGPYENWLIAPPVDIDQSPEKSLAFVTQAAYPAEDSKLEVYVLDGPDVKTAKATRLEATIATPPEKNYSDWVSSGKIDLSAFSGVVYIGFKYTSAKGGSNFSTTYGVDNINIGGAEEVDPVIPPAEDEIYSGLDQKAAECDWTFENVTLGAGLSYVWSWKEYNGNHYLNGSAFAGGSSKESLAYAISPVIDLTGKSEAVVSFEHAAKYQTTLQELCGFCVREAGTTEWTELEIQTWPGTTGWTFVNSGDMDLKAFLGKKIELAFKYGSSSEGADTWEVKNVKVIGE